MGAKRACLAISVWNAQKPVPSRSGTCQYALVKGLSDSSHIECRDEPDGPLHVDEEEMRIAFRERDPTGRGGYL